MRENYYIGLDMGTSSLGWAVTDSQYQLLRKKGKDLWGVRLFDEAKTAEERRTKRTARRRLQREKVRIGYLKEFFSEEIGKKDAGFYQRLDDSKFFEEDKQTHQPYALFSDQGYTDKEYYKDYPTIFHLRKELIESKEPHDVRLVYLAILNIYKHRGHFLNANLDGKGIGDPQNYYDQLKELSAVILDIELPPIDKKEWFQELLSSKDYSKSAKVEKILEHFQMAKSKNKRQTEIWKLICGLKGTLSKIFTNEFFEEENRKFSISFEDSNYEESSMKVEELLGEDSYEIYLLMKRLHDWGLVANIMKGQEYLSFARVAAYEKHGRDLKLLKRLYKMYAPDQYDEMFRVMDDNNYSSYVGSVNSRKQPERRGAKCKEEDFFKRIRKQVEEFPESKGKTELLQEIEKGNFLPKQLNSSNGVIPYQVHKIELQAILGNAEEYLGFLKEKDESGLTVSEKIVRLFEFQIPYYIGPLFSGAEESKNVWSVRKESGRVLPWNFEQKMDVKASAEKFISRMVKHCTYISGENVLPKNSLLYEKFMVLNELNNLRVNGEKISPLQKQQIFRDLFMKGKKVSQKRLVDFLKANGWIDANEQPDITGIDGGFTKHLSNYEKFTKILGVDSLNYEQEKMVEKIIFWATVYGDTKKFLKEKIEDEYGAILTKEQIMKIIGFKFKDWGRLSKKLLEIEGADKKTGEVQTVIQRMWNENYNLMELIESGKFTYREEIEKYAGKLEKSLLEIEYEDLEDLYISAPVRRMIWQTILVLKEIYQVMGYGPSRVFVEMARDPDTVKQRTISRKSKFVELYKKCKEEGRNWAKEIEGTEETKFRSKKLYLYYTQKGRCMYTGERIELSDLFNDNQYDIDHIYPRHFVKDDSIENNLVLVRKEENAHKSDSFPIEGSIRRDQKKLWQELRQGGFITEEKYRRLTRTTDFTDDERVSFISRQIVETRQGTKVITDLFGWTFPDSEIVYVKAGNVSAFRQTYDLIKCRNVNDFHHAQDAYLNIVVGNVYYVKFTKNPYHFIKQYKKNPTKNPYHMYKVFDYRVERNGDVAWETKEHKSIRIVKKMMKKNTPLVTRRNYEEHGGFADQNICSAKSAAKVGGKGYTPIKSSDQRLEDVTKYGGYTKMAGGYFFLVEYTKKNKQIRSLEPMPLYLKDQLDTKEKVEEYCRTNLGYEKPDVRLMKIKMYSLIKVNGFFLYLTGRSGDRLLVCNAVQLVLSYEQIKYVKEITKAAEQKYTEEQLLKSSKITREDNIELYSVLIDKHLHSIYCKRPNAVGEKLHLRVGEFEQLNLVKQCYVLLQILQLTQIMNQGADLTDIGESKKTGVSLINKKITEQNEFKLINQSVTGLFESEIDLLTV